MAEYIWKCLVCLWKGHSWKDADKYGEIWCRRCGAGTDK
jgi:DNA-directed RNA polymerase subunit RPC12/RpoP